MINYRYLFILILLALFSGTGLAQNFIIKGKVLDETQETLIGATIQEVGNPTNGTITDLDGNFQLTVKKAKAKLRVSYIGYVEQLVDVHPNQTVVIRLAPDSKVLDEVVIVGYGQQKRITSTGAVNAIQGAGLKSLKSVPASNLNNTLVGRLPGFFSQQRSGEPGNDQADMFIRGVNSLNGDSKPLIIVDDVEYEYSQFAQLNVNEIENITILKDAATTAIYGLKGANGVIVVTTTRGKEGKPQINLTIEGGFNSVIQRPEFLDSYNSALLLNEAVLNDSYGSGTEPKLPFTAQDLALFKSGEDPYGHPNVNWQDELLKKHSSSARYNIDVKGGNKLVKYYTSLGYFTQGGIVKHHAPLKKDDDADNNYYYNRINFRSNLDITPTKTTSIRLDMNGRFETQNTPMGKVSDSMFAEIYEYKHLAPFATPLVNPDGSYGYNNYYRSSDAINPIFRYANSGYQRKYKNNFNIVAGVNQKLDIITKGLSAKVNVSYAGNFNEYRKLSRDPKNLPAYRYNEDGTYTLRDSKVGKIPVYSLEQKNDGFNYTVILQGMLNYDRVFHDHHVYGLLLFNQRSYVDKEKLKVNYIGTTFRAGYDYKQRYMVEFNIARNGNDQFREDERYGIFPAISVGWNLGAEKFFHNAFPFVDMLKLRGSYGLVGSDTSYSGVVDEEITYTTGSNWYGSTVIEGSLVNPYVTWEKERKLDLGVDLSLFNSKLSLTVDYFYNYRYDQLISQGDISSIIGQGLPKKNMGETSNRGFDGSIIYRDRFAKDFNYSIGLNFSNAVNKIEYVSEAPDYPYQARTGTRLNTPYGYHCLGFYQVDDFDESGNLREGIAAPSWSSVQPGDLKYADMNKDGVITDADKTYMDKMQNLPSTVYGLNLGFGYKGFSVEMLWQGAFDYYYEHWRGGIDAFDSNMQAFHLDRWTPATAYTATFPRMSFNAMNNSSSQTRSDFWLNKAHYIRLKSLNVNYQISADWLQRVCPFIASARLYLVGYNLLTFHNLDKYKVDPEAEGAGYRAYPTTANYTLGIQIGF